MKNDRDSIWWQIGLKKAYKIPPAVFRFPEEEAKTGARITAEHHTTPPARIIK